MSNDDVLLQQQEPPPKEPLPGGAVYIGNSNTRGVVMQIHLQRFQQALLANLTGLAATSAWLAVGNHPTLALIALIIGCAFSVNLNRLWIDLIQYTAVNLEFWTGQINELVSELGIKDYLQPKTTIERPTPKVQQDQLYRPLKQCIVAWVVIGLTALSIVVDKQQGEVQWLTCWQVHLHLSF